MHPEEKNDDAAGLRLDQVQDFSALQLYMTTSACCPSTRTMRLLSVQQLHNEHLWERYQSQKTLMQRRHEGTALVLLNTQQPRLDMADMSKGLDELYLLHGTTAATARKICEFGFDPRLAKPKGLYGRGTYFASRSCKSHYYSSQGEGSQYVILVCRVLMGAA
jgi:hypothetical protein